MKNTLEIREWVIVAFVVGLIFACSALSWITRHQASADISKWTLVTECRKEIEIELVGAVIMPGIYRFSPGVTLKEALKAAGISKQADRKKINFKKIIYESERIEIPSKPKKGKVKSRA